jgi:hypothetical protein
VTSKKKKGKETGSEELVKKDRSTQTKKCKRTKIKEEQEIPKRN